MLPEGRSMGVANGLMPGSHNSAAGPSAYGWTCLLTFLLIGCATPFKDSNSSPAELESEWTSLFDGRTLGGWRPTGFLLPGTVSVENGVIILGLGDGLTGITWAGEEPLPRNDYEIALEARRLSGIDFFCGLTFPVGDEYVTFIVGGWGGNVVGISSIDRFDASENETTTYMTFETERWYSIRVRVSDSRIQTWIDDEPAVDIDTTSRHLEVRPDVSLSRPLGIAAWNTTAALRNLRLRRLDPEV